MITPGHRRTLNCALHELRRPLQALVLMESEPGGRARTSASPDRRELLDLATVALRDLDGAVNGNEEARPRQRFAGRDVVFACLERWRSAATRLGGIRSYWDAGPAQMEGDPIRLGQALDNLVANALEHGGPPIVLTGAKVATRVRVTFANGVGASAPAPLLDPRRGHGTRIASEVARAHGGRFALCHTASGCVAALELPLAEPGYARAA